VLTAQSAGAAPAGALRTVCGGCGHTGLDTVLDLGVTPAANTLPATVGEAETFHPLRLGVCPRCWLVQQLGMVPDVDLYGPGYGFYSSASLPKREYHTGLARRLLAAHPAQCGQGVVEVACNDGDLLHHFRDVGCPTLGVDPSPGPAGKATNLGLEVWVEPFTVDCAARILDRHGPAGLLVANHVAAHVQDLHGFFAAVDLLLDADGVAVVEVQYLADLLVGNQIDHVYHEHRYHFTLTTLAAVAAQHHLAVADVRHTPAQSGSISVTLRRHPHRVVDVPDPAGLLTPAANWSVAHVLHAERWTRDGGAYASLQGRAEHIRDRLLDLLDEQQRVGRVVAGYAAPAKAVTLLNWCGVTPDLVRYVVDTTPYKAGRFIPGVRIPIVGRHWSGVAADQYGLTRGVGHDLPDTWLLLAWNYVSDVLRRERDFTAGGGQWILPIPVPVLL
jgi:C-methyltransferase C-terminal domain/Putative zinc binding domain/Methyltransferase domain